MLRLILVGILGVAALIAASALTGLSAASGHGDGGGETVRVIARLHANGQIEFGLRTSTGNQFPRQRFFPTTVTHENWLRSSTLELADGTVVRIIARRMGETRVEFGVRIDDLRRDFLPTRRFFPRSANVGNWLSSTPVLLPAAEADRTHDEPEPEPPDPETTEPEEPDDTDDDTGDETTDEASDVERISGGHRDGLIVEGNIIGDPDAPVLIVEYGDPF